jgi:hypothetical protein
VIECQITACCHQRWVATRLASNELQVLPEDSKGSEEEVFSRYLADKCLRGNINARLALQGCMVDSCSSPIELVEGFLKTVMEIW